MADGLLERWAEFLPSFKEIFDQNYDRAFGGEPDFVYMIDRFAEFVFDNELQDRMENLDLTDLVDYFLDMRGA